ncbi:glycosyltransferase family 2 protein [Fortiea contorta]|uniref:glycosyltransferase family 2 protein n=1 Tax=Fortiea contorta TaxID=1892405 RepID=UPI000345A52B|nr:glycosyltransferase family A protein [Fortiea contorta]
MTSDSPLISVIIPVYNRDRYLAEAIESVLAQTYPAIELIVVDDGSSDRSAEVAQRYPLIYHYQPNGGIGSARNAGIALATGEFLAFLDSDDIWVTDKLSKQMAAFETDPTLEVVFGYTQQFYSPELDETFRQSIRCPEQPIAGYLSNMMLIRRSTFLQVGLFNPELKCGIDIEWYGRAAEQKLKMTLLPDVIHLRRLHETNNGLLEADQHKERLHVLKAMLDRRRQVQPDQSPAAS